MLRFQRVGEKVLWNGSSTSSTLLFSAWGAIATELLACSLISLHNPPRFFRSPIMYIRHAADNRLSMRAHLEHAQTKSLTVMSFSSVLLYDGGLGAVMRMYVYKRETGRTKKNTSKNKQSKEPINQ